MSVKFEGYERRIAKIEKALAEYGIESLEAARDLCLSKGVDVEAIVKGVQPIAFENAVWAYTLGAAIAFKAGAKDAAEAAEKIGIGLQAFCIPGSVADNRAVGLGHGNLAAMLLREETKCFCFLAGHESFAAAEGAIGIAKTANKVRKDALRVILNGLGKDAAYIISRINGFTFVETEYDYYTGELKIVEEKLELVGLSGFGNFMPAELSGGMRKRAGLARALALEPDLLFFDEPSAGLDPVSSADLDRMILKLRTETGATIVVVTHELDSIFAIGDRALMLDKERRTLVADDTPENLLKYSSDPWVKNFMNRGGLGCKREF